jgi:biopolymer transport protein ExbD
MRFERHASLFREPLDAAPVAGVLMLLLIFMLLCSLLYTPGVTIHLPEAGRWPGTDNPTVVVAVDSRGQCFFENEAVQEGYLEAKLKERQTGTARQSRKLTMVLWADKAATLEVIARLELLARQAGITEVLLAERPPMFAQPP